MGRPYMPSVNAGMRAFKWPTSTMPESLIIDHYSGIPNPDWQMWPDMLGQELYFDFFGQGGPSPSTATAAYRRDFAGEVECTLGFPPIPVTGTWSYILTFWRTNPFAVPFDETIIGHSLFVAYGVNPSTDWIYRTTDSSLTPSVELEWELPIVQVGDATPCFFPNLPPPSGVVVRKPTWAERSTPFTYDESDPVAL